MPSKTKKETIVLSLGGSLIVPAEGVDAKFISAFFELIKHQVKKGKQFIIICGGGKTARMYQRAAAEITKLTRDDLDWLGIHATRLNAHLLRTIFRTLAHPRIITDPREPIPAAAVVIGAGWRPGCSTDFDAVLLAKKRRAHTLINLSNISYVYDSDPRTNPEAKALTDISWKAFRKMFGTRWDPGLNSPFDPVASKEAERLGMRVIIAEGKDLENVERILNGEKFKGTVIG